MVVHYRHATRDLRHGADLEACCVCYLEIETIKMEHFMLWMGEPVEAALDVASISVAASEGLRQRGAKHIRRYLDEPCAPGVCSWPSSACLVTTLILVGVWGRSRFVWQLKIMAARGGCIQRMRSLL
jgi:hypothetical protein